jgi:S-adenosylmethionine:tRNA ribosyltransferase-isomerase
MHPKHLKIEDYTYQLPDDKIAHYPLPQRDASKLLIYKDGSISESVYADIAKQIPSGALMVFNQTKVVHARLLFRKTTGGVIEIFCLEPAAQTDIQTAMLQREKVLWKCMVGGASKWKHGIVLDMNCADGGFNLYAAIAGREADAFIIELSWDRPELTFAEVLHYAGKVPLPPYLHREASSEDEANYQTIFAKQEGSVAAPTAGLHFTDNVMSALKEHDIDTAFVTLHVGAGTFKPVKAAVMESHEMHAEWIDVDATTIKQIRNSLDTGIVAVGTTSLRTLESLYWMGVKMTLGETVDLQQIAVSQWDPYELKTAITATDAFTAIIEFLRHNNMPRLVTRTQIIIAPGYQFKVVGGLVTNFHQPQSTLLLLVAAFIGEDWRMVYDYALDHNYRFLSYGDGNLFWRSRSLNI